MSVLSKPYFHDEGAAFAYLESVLWPRGPVCPHCGNVDPARFYALKGKTTRLGLKKCAECRKPFTVKVGTVFESAHIPLHKMLQAVYLLTSSKKGFSAHQLHWTLGITYQSAWFLAHRIREAMRTGGLAPFGGTGGAVEVDETFIGHDKTIKPKGERKGRGYHHKHKVLCLVDRDSGQARSMVVDDLKAATLAPIVRENVAKEARLMTDEASYYTLLGREFAEHGVVHHGQQEYVSKNDRTIHTNTIEGYFSVFKRGMKGVYQHCGKKHLHRYLAEFDFRYNSGIALGVDDAVRADRALSGIVGKRLTYHGLPRAM
jgi:transposase-like protein